MSSQASYAALINANARRISEMHARIHETLRTRSSVQGRKDWEEACAEFHSSYDNLAFPGGYEAGLRRISENDSEAIEAALVFLEIRPYFFRSGYMRQKLMRMLRHATLTAERAQRFEAVLAAQRQWRVSDREHR